MDAFSTQAFISNPKTNLPATQIRPPLVCNLHTSSFKMTPEEEEKTKTVSYQMHKCIVSVPLPLSEPTLKSQSPFIIITS